VRPADHPDFYRRPPPEGRSRESTIRLDREGRFWHGGAPVAHPGLARALHTWIARHPDDGRYILVNGYDWTYFAVEDTPFFVTSLRVGPGAVTLALSDGTEEPLDPHTLRADGRGVLTARVKGGAFTARFLRPAQAALTEVLEEGPAGAPQLRVGGEVFAVGVE
jgi:hypothetical protein